MRVSMTPSLCREPLPSPGIVGEAAMWRRYLHQYPELAYREHRTADFIAAKLQEFGLLVHRGLGGTGVIGTLKRGTGTRVIGIRADMDALPLIEQSGVAHESTQSGVAHACGHDGHIAMALAAARACAAMPELDGTIHFIFQPAEECEGGAKRMLAEGLFRLFPCDMVFALHNWPTLPVGSCVVQEGALMAAMATFKIRFLGQGCHGAMPHEGVDPIAAAAHLVSALQTVVSRNVDPREMAVLSVTQVHAGDAWNIIPDSAEICGTTRWFEDKVGDLLERRVAELARATAAAFNCTAGIAYERRYDATVNHRSAVNILRQVAVTLLPGLRYPETKPSMAAEDFGAMLQAVPGCYVLLGAARVGENPMLHSPRFDFNDEVLPLGIALWVSLVRTVLSSPGSAASVSPAGK